MAQSRKQKGLSTDLRGQSFMDGHSFMDGPSSAHYWNHSAGSSLFSIGSLKFVFSR